MSTAPPQTVHDTIADLRNHLDWSGERASSETFKLLSLDAPEGPAAVGTTFSSSGAADNGTFQSEAVQNSRLQFSHTKRFARKLWLCPPQRWHRRQVPPEVHSIGSVVSPG